VAVVAPGDLDEVTAALHVRGRRFRAFVLRRGGAETGAGSRDEDGEKTFHIEYLLVVSLP
jgi:hypothetical protein